MEFALIIWFISSLSNIAYFLGWLTFLCLLCALGALLIFTDADSLKDKELKGASSFWVKTFVVIAFVSAFTATILPSTKTGWMMAAGYLGQTALQSESAKKLGAIVEIKLQDVLDEVTEQAKIKAKSINEPKKEKE